MQAGPAISGQCMACVLWLSACSEFTKCMSAFCSFLNILKPTGIWVTHEASGTAASIKKCLVLKLAFELD